MTGSGLQRRLVLAEAGGPGGAASDLAVVRRVVEHAGDFNRATRRGAACGPRGPGPLPFEMLGHHQCPVCWNEDARNRAGLSQAAVAPGRAGADAAVIGARELVRSERR